MEAGYLVILPESGSKVITIGVSQLKDNYAGYAMLVKPVGKVDTRAGAPEPQSDGHWLLSTLWRYRRYYWSAALSALLINVLALAGTFFTMNVYDRVVPNQAFTTLWSLATGVSLAMLFEFISRNVRAHVLDVAGKKADLIMGAMLFKKALAIHMEHKPASSGSFANQLLEFESVRDFVASATLASISDLPFTFLYVAVIFMIGGMLGFIPLLLIPVIIGVSVFIQWSLKKVMKENLRESSLKQGVLIETVEGIETLKATGGERYMQERWELFSAKASDTSMKSKRLSALAMNFVSWIRQFETVMIVVAGVYLIADGKLTQGALVGCVILASRALAPLAQVAGLAVRFQQVKAALDSLSSLMKKPEERDPEVAYLNTGVAAGDVSSSSIDAINGSQLAGVSSSFATAIGGGSMMNADGSITLPSFNVGGTTVHNGGDAINNLDGRVTSNTSDLTNLQTQVTNIANNGGAATPNAVAYDTAAHDKLTLGSTAGGTTSLTNLSDATLSATGTDAMTGKQLFDTNNQVASLSSAVSNISTTGSASIGINSTNGIDGAPGTPGAASATGSDAIAMGDKAAASGDHAVVIGGGASGTGDGTIAIGGNAGASGKDSIAIGNGASAPVDNAVALGANSVADRDNSVSVGSQGAERQITNVAAGCSQPEPVELGDERHCPQGVQRYRGSHCADDDSGRRCERKDRGSRPVSLPWLMF
jgi:hypothetical protein